LTFVNNINDEYLRLKHKTANFAAELKIFHMKSFITLATICLLFAACNKADELPATQISAADVITYSYDASNVNAILDAVENPKFSKKWQKAKQQKEPCNVVIWSGIFNGDISPTYVGCITVQGICAIDVLFGEVEQSDEYVVVAESSEPSLLEGRTIISSEEFGDSKILNLSEE